MPRGLAAAALAADSIGFEAGGPLDVVLRRPGSRGCTGLSLGDLDSCSSPDVLPFRWQAPTRHTSFVVAAAAAAGVISKTSAGRAEAWKRFLEPTESAFGSLGPPATAETLVRPPNSATVPEPPPPLPVDLQDLLEEEGGSSGSLLVDLLGTTAGRIVLGGCCFCCCACLGAGHLYAKAKERREAGGRKDSKDKDDGGASGGSGGGRQSRAGSGSGSG
eukprot:TRINITY_DN20006_c0_g1_i1.p1 TRINITY_DN20006_c0_g1~~TRINITY_DN20006_c0_g1_i1.p1  ORF type:complete len:218 (-),score=37.84 TRINITY_DN20006_c0_g1_i1:87-740(-)